MRKLAAAAFLALVPLVPAQASAQGIGVGAKIGTLGYGVDAGLSLNSKVTLRGGIAFSPEELPFANIIPTDDIGGLDYTLLVPTTTLQAGVDVKLLGPLKIMGGLIYRSEDLRARSDVSGSYQIGNETYTQTGEILATLDQNEILPYAGIGFGTVTGSGIGLYVDLAIAYSGEAEVVMSASDNLESIPGFTTELQREADQFLTDLPSFADNLYPVLQVGLRFGLGN